MRTPTKQFLAGLKLLKRLSPTGPTLPVLREVLFTGTHMVVTDLQAELAIPFKTEKGFRTDAHVLCAAVSKLAGHELVDITIHGSSVSIEAGGIRFDLTAEMEAEDTANFPRIRIPETRPLFSGIPTKALKTAVKFVGRDEIRPVMTTVYIGNDIVGTDAHILYRKELTAMPDGESGIMVPKQVVALLPTGIDIDISKSVADKLVFETVLPGDVVLRWRGIDGRYPNYMGVWPEKSDKVVRVSTKSLKEAVAAASTASNSYTKQGKFVFGTGLVVESESDMFGCRCRCVVPVIDHNLQSEFRMGLNLAYLKRVLDEIKTEEVEIKMTAPNKCATINDEFLIMPVMLNEEP